MRQKPSPGFSSSAKRGASTDRRPGGDRERLSRPIRAGREKRGVVRRQAASECRLAAGDVEVTGPITIGAGSRSDRWFGRRRTVDSGNPSAELRERRRETEQSVSRSDRGSHRRAFEKSSSTPESIARIRSTETPRHGERRVKSLTRILDDVDEGHGGRCHRRQLGNGFPPWRWRSSPWMRGRGQWRASRYLAQLSSSPASSCRRSAREGRETSIRTCVAESRC